MFRYKPHFKMLSGVISCLTFLITPNIKTTGGANVRSRGMVMFHIAFDNFSCFKVSANPCFAASVVVGGTSPTDYSSSLIGDHITVRVIVV